MEIRSQAGIDCWTHSTGSAVFVVMAAVVVAGR
jgi:hypothetical protein